MSDPAQSLTPSTYRLRVGGLSLFASGGCLMWTVILIPLALPLGLIGLGMFIASFFTKRETMTCPACQQSYVVEPAVNVVVCPGCQLPSRREGSSWVRVQP